MARTPHDAVAALLRRTPLPTAVRADAWDAFHGAATPDELTPRLRKLALPQVVRASLWDLKAKHAAKKESQMLPRESKYGRDGDVLPDSARPNRLKGVMPSAATSERLQSDQSDVVSAIAGAQHPAENTAPVSRFIAQNFRHFNAATLHDAAEAYKAHLAKGGQMLVSLAGAMSTAELGRTLAPMIRENKVHCISCTAANLEESMFLLLASDDYERFPDYTEHTPEDDAALAKRKINRVTDVGIPEQAAMTPLEDAFTKLLKRNRANGVRAFPHELLYEIVQSKMLETHYQDDPKNSWLVAAAEKHLPIVVPAFEDSTLGNVFAAACLTGEFPPALIKGGVDYMLALAQWYETISQQHAMGFFQIGGGVAGDFAICVVPMLAQDADKKGINKWSYFCQITDSHDSYGGYSGARPVEKNSWAKTNPASVTFDIHSDATICAPLIFGYVLGW